MEIKFNNRQELKKYLDYLEDVEIEDTLKNNHINNYYGRENYMDLFLDKIFNRDYIDMFSFADLVDNEKISKLLWGIWIEDGEKWIDELYDYEYSVWLKLTQCFKECFSTNWEEERKEKEKLEKEYKRKLEGLEREYKKEVKELNKRYNK